jgi:hypothetical protein
MTTLRLMKSTGVISGAQELTTGDAEPDKSIFVIFTSNDQTLRALDKAAEIAKALHLSIVMVAAQSVPFPLPLDEPPLPIKFIVKRFEELADRFPEDVEIRVYLCRNSIEIFKQILRADCPAVIGFKKRRWLRFSWEEKIARTLRRAGFCLITVETE